MIRLVKSRHDEWTKEEDSLLAKVVLSHIQNGGSQRRAFEEAGRSLSRTAAACGYRWYSNVRNKFSKEINFALKRKKDLGFVPVGQNKQAKYSKGLQAEAEGNYPQTFEGLIETLYNKAFDCFINSTEFKQAAEEISNLNQKLLDLAAENDTILREKNRIEEEYLILSELIDSARSLLQPKADTKAPIQKNNSTNW